MATTDFSQVPDDQMEHIFGLLENNPEFIPNVAERQAFVAEYFRRKRGEVTTPKAGDFPDPVESAGAPVSADPVLKPRGWRGMSDDQMRAAGKKGTPESKMVVPRADLPAYARRYRDVLEEDTQRYIAESRTPRRVAEPVAVSDEAPMVTVDGVQVQGQWDALGPGLGNVQYTLGGVRRAQEAQDAAFARVGGRRGVPGAPTDDGSPVAPPPEFATPDEAEQYNMRPTDPETGRLLPSKADEAMLARGYVAVYTPDGNISYRPAANAPGQQDRMSPAARRRGDFLVGRSADGRTDLPINKNYEVQEVEGPTGPVQALVPTRESRDRIAARANRASANRVAVRTGLNPAQLMDPVARGEALRTHNDNEMQARRALLRMRNMLAGGSNNINSANIGAFTQLAMMHPGVGGLSEDQIRQLRYALPGGQLQAQVDARQFDNAMELAKPALTGRLAGAVDQDMALQLRRDQRLQELRAKAAAAKADAWGGSEQNDALEALELAGASPDERRQIMLELFPPASAPTAAPARPEGQGNFGRMPDGTYPMM